MNVLSSCLLQAIIQGLVVLSVRLSDHFSDDVGA